MVRPASNGDAHYGPFFEITALKAVLSEFAKIMLGAGNVFSQFFEPKKRSDFEMKIYFMETQGLWLEKFFKHKMNWIPIEELRALLRMLSLQPE
jgi:hypothetical protein